MYKSQYFFVSIYTLYIYYIYTCWAHGLAAPSSSDIFLLSRKLSLWAPCPHSRLPKMSALSTGDGRQSLKKRAEGAALGCLASIPRDVPCFPQGPRYVSLPASRLSYSSPKAKPPSALSPYPRGVKVVGSCHKGKSASCSSENVHKLSCCWARGDKWP